MIEGAYVSDALITQSYKIDSINLIVAGCGTGKTTAAFNTIPSFLGVKPARCLVLIDTSAGEEQFVKEGYANFYDEFKDWDGWDQELENSLPNLPTVMTYQRLGALIKKQQLHPEDYDYIVADEFHSITVPISIDRAKIKAQYSFCDNWELNDMLRMTSFTFIAAEAIKSWAEDDHTWVFGLSATPQPLEKLASIFNIINEVKMSSTLRAFETISKLNYIEIEDILKMRIASNEKRIFYFNTVKELQKYKQLLQEYGRSAEAIWSVNNTNVPMTKQQKITRDYVLDNHQLPEEIQDLLINAAYLTAIDIKDEAVKRLYIHDGNEVKREQVRGRLRQDLDAVGYYDSNRATAKKKAQKRNQQIRNNIQKAVNQVIDLPSQYLDVKLLTEDKDKILQELNYPKGWTTFKKALLSQGYNVKDGMTKREGKNYRYSTISKS